jgi:predicted Rossmann-fold nucleotide-binding protein
MPRPVTARHWCPDANRLAFADLNSLLWCETRAIRIQLEMPVGNRRPKALKKNTIVVFGSARLAPEQAQARSPWPSKAMTKSHWCRPCHMRNARYYDQASLRPHRGGLVAATRARSEQLFICTGGPGIMEAANRGAGNMRWTVGLNIVSCRTSKVRTLYHPLNSSVPLFCLA